MSRRQAPVAPTPDRRRARRRAAVVLALLAGCTAPAQVQYERRLATASGPDTHAVHSQRLQQLMRSVQLYADGRLPVAMDTEAEWQSHVDDIARVSEAMAESAGLILEVAPSLGLSAAERRQFDGLAVHLRDQAEALASDAHTLSTTQLRRRLAAIDQTCNACHDRFRTPPID